MELAQFAEHLHIAYFQYNQFDKLADDIHDNNIAVMCIDFAENYNCTHQNEVACPLEWGTGDVFSQLNYFIICLFFLFYTN